MSQTVAVVTSRRRRGLGYLLLALLAYVPALLTAPGRVVADTKQYLYLDPTRVLERAWSMWDANIGMGTVTHQNIGYLFPLGPFYWCFDTLGAPDWVAQRLWLGSILFGAGLGMLFLFRTLGLRGAGAVVGALAFMLSPYSLEYAARLSVLLLPWAGLPWMLGFVIRGLREGGWKYPALFALTVQVVGSVNVTALVFAGVAPLLWIPYGLWVLREFDWRRALATIAKVGALTLAASLWWLAGLWAQGAYGLNILKYTETLRVVSRTTLPNEVLRGLGYWFFYGRDRLGPWIEGSTSYTQRPVFILISYGIPVLALLGAAFVRWRHRGYFVFLTLVGVVMAVGSHPYDSPTAFGAVFRRLSAGSTVAFALRSTGRAVPLVVLGLAALLAAGVNALVAWSAEREWRVASVAVPIVVGALVIVNLPALWNGQFYGENLQRDEQLPGYWDRAAAYLDAQGDATRVLEVPGSDFASYRWGNTVDPITPGIMDRPYVARELIPYGSPASANLLNAFDLRLQDRKLTPDAIAPLARLTSVGDITLRNDIQFERYRLLRPLFTWDLFQPTPSGLTGPKTFGAPAGTQSTQYPFLDDQTLTAPPTLELPPPLAVFGVEHPADIVRSAAATRPTVLAGDGDGMVDASEAGLLAGDPLLLYSASFGRDAAALRAQIGRDATLVVTDSNRDRARRWSTLTETAGYTEGPGTHPLTTDESDARLDLFPDAPRDAYTTTVLHGAKSVAANDYGNPITYTPEDRATRAFDGDPSTAWRTGKFDDVRGDRIRIALDAPITTDHVNLVQVLPQPNERYVTRAVLRFDGGIPVTVQLGARSRTIRGQTVRFPQRRFSTFELEIRDTNLGQLPLYGGVSPVGFGEIRLRDSAPGSHPVRVTEVLQMPGDLLRVAGSASAGQPLLLLMSRDRVLPGPARTDPERSLTRQFTLPTPRSFAVGGDVRLSARRSDAEIDRLLGYTGPVVARSSARLVDAPSVRASAALDGDPATAWVTPFKTAVGSWISVSLPEPTTIDHLDLRLVADGRHSVPTQLEIRSDTGETRTVTVPARADQPAPNATVVAPLTFAPLTGVRFRVKIAAVRPVLTKEYDCGCDVETPAAVSELGMPSVSLVTVPARLPDDCRSDLITIDGRPVPVRVSGTTADAVALAPLELRACDDVSRTAAAALEAGTRVVRAAAGSRVGFDVDRLVLSSAAGGGVATDLSPSGTQGARGTRAGGSTPKVEVTSTGRASVRARVRDATRPFWLVLGESQNAGWRATVNGRDLGGSTLVDGYANGWLVRPGGGKPLFVSLEWVPQQTVDRALAISVVSVLACLGIVAVSVLRRRRRGATAAAILDLEGTVPRLGSPLVADGRTPGPVGIVLTTLLTFAAGSMLARPDIGLVLAAAVALVLVRPRRRAVLSLVPAAALALCGAYIAIRQVRHHLPPLFEWPTLFAWVRTLGWITVLFLAGDALVELVRERRRGPRP